MTTDYEPRAVLRVSGADAAHFLQGQLCNDIDAVTASRGQLSALSSPKGRVLAVFRVMQGDDSLHLSLPASLAETIAATLRRYVLRSKVLLEVNPANIAAVACCRLPDGLAAPDQPYDCSRADELTAMRLPGSAPLFEVVGPAQALAELFDQAELDRAALGTICAGVPDVVPSTSGAFVAQMLNLDKLDAISFTKGCYTGQEVIARTQNLGRIKRRMLRFAGDAPATPPDPGEALEAGAGSSTAGKVVSAARSGDAGFELLAVMRLDAIEKAPVRLASGVRLNRATLPY